MSLFIWTKEYGSSNILTRNMRWAQGCKTQTKSTPTVKFKPSLHPLTVPHGFYHLQIAELNLMAGKICIRTLSFHSAARYFTNGIALLPGDCFENEYQLSLELHDLAQNTLSMTGDFDKMSSLASRELSHAKCFQDKVNTCELCF